MPFKQVTAAAHELRERLQALEAVAEVLRETSRGSSGALADLLQKQPALLALFNWGVLVTDRNGTALVSLPESMGRQGVNYGEVESIRLAVSEGHAQIGRALFGKTTGKPVIPLVVPVHDRSGQVTGTLIGLTNLAAANFLDDISSNRFGRQGGYLITDPEQREAVLWYTLHPEVWGQGFTTEAARAVVDFGGCASR